MLVWNIRGLSPLKYVSADPIWEMGDIINIVETWQHESNTIVELQGFTLVGSTWNQRKQHAGREHGGIATFIKSKLLPVIHLEAQDFRGQYHWLRLMLGGYDYYLAICYFAPLAMPIYSTHLCNRSQPFHRLISDVLKYQSKGDVFLAGKFNARIRYTQFTQFCTSFTSSPLERIDDSQWSRVSSDPSSNSLTEHFLVFGATCNLKVLNGISRFPNSHHNTCFSTYVPSIVDFLLSSSFSTSLISTFEVLNPQPESDHAPLLFTLSISNNIIPPINKHVLSFPTFHLLHSKKDLYATHLQDLLKHTE